MDGDVLKHQLDGHGFADGEGLVLDSGLGEYGGPLTLGWLVDLVVHVLPQLLVPALHDHFIPILR